MLFFAPHPLLSSLAAIEGYLKTNQGWQPRKDDDNQKKLIRGYYAERSDLGLFREKELKTYADQSAAKLNEILKEEGFDIRLGGMGTNGVGAVSVMRLIFCWIDQAIRGSMNIRGKKYASMEFSTGFSVLHSPDHNFPIIKLKAMGGYEVFITAQGDRRTIPANGFVLYETIQKIISSAGKMPDDFDFFKMPIIKVKADMDVSWMMGMKITPKGRPGVTIEQAKEQIKLDIDEKGVSMEVASALGPRSSENKKERCGLTIAESFLILARKAGVPKGVLYGFIDDTGWLEVSR